MHKRLSIVLPAKNESQSLDALLPRIKSVQPDAEIIVVNDGSTDDTVSVCTNQGVTVISHPFNMGNGASIKTGARNATGDIIVFMDADGQHDPADIQRLLEKLDQGYEMAVGARDSMSQASLGRWAANSLYNRLASAMTGQKILDLTSGFRAARARHFRKFLYLLPNGFSYPTTSTMAFFRSGLPVGYVPIKAARREGTSHIRLLKDGTRFLVIILKVGALFSPMRFFLPISLLLFLIGAGYYAYTFSVWDRLTNMSAILFLSALFTFLIGIVSEQISSLHYKNTSDDMRRSVRPDSEEND